MLRNLDAGRRLIARMHQSLRLFSRRGDWPRLRAQLCYWWRHDRRANLASPSLLTEHVVRRKLHDRDPRFPQLADKVAVKRFVRDQIGSSWTVPTLWRGTALPDEPAWPMPFVVKSRHGCGHVQVVRDAQGYGRACAASRRWMRGPYGVWLDEWLYAQIPLGLLVEPFVGDGPELPLDYKLFVFGGRVRFIQVHLDRAGDHRWIVFDLDWRRVSPATADGDLPRPVSLGRMIEAAETLGAGFAFVRTDFYEVAGRPLFGELTFYPGSGLERVEPLALDVAMGAWWNAALDSAPYVATGSSRLASP